MTTTIDAEKELRQTIGSLANDPVRFVKFAYPWGQDGTPLRQEEGPEPWQQEFLAHLGDEIKKNKFNGKEPVECVRQATASGHGIGKSALTSWIIHFIMSTRPFCRGTVTANTSVQLNTKTWAELAKWTSLLINRHWFEYRNVRGGMVFFQKDNKDTWFCTAQTCREENSESFAGQHAADSTSFYIFDEASAVPDKIWEVAEGGLTDGEPMFFAFGNPTRNVGRFFECFGRQKHRWITRQVDSRQVSRTNKTQINEWVKDWGEDSDFVRVRVRGVFPSSGSLQLISSELVREALGKKIDHHSYHYAPRIMGVDVARFGDDQSVICKRQGLACLPFLKYRELDTMEMAGRVAAEIMDWKPHACFIDSVGIGAGVLDRLKQVGHQPIGVNVGMKSSRAGYFNKRAEIWCAVRDWLKSGGVLPDDVEIETDLTSLEYGYDAAEKLRLEKKEDMKKRGLSSPDCGDALALTFSMQVTRPSEYDLVAQKNERCKMEYNVLTGARR